MSIKSSSQYSFAQVPNVFRPRSKFDRSCNYKTTMDAGFLYPIYLQDVLPGDTVNLNLTAFMRLTTPIVPFMDNLYADFFFFYVPNRLVWEHWRNFMGEQADPDSSIDYLVPQIHTGSGFNVGDLADYFAIPTGVEDLSVDAMPFRAYNLIWNEWFRDENLQDSQQVDLGDETVEFDDSGYLYFHLLRRGKRHDYFTSANPFPQKGPGVELPLGTYAPVIGNGMALGLTDGTNSAGSIVAPDSGLNALVGNFGSDVGDSYVGSTVLSSKVVGVVGDAENSGLIADLSEATAATINSLRTAFQIQHLYEAFARGGTRYNELVLSCFGVTIPDQRLQRPEYLGGGEIPINIHSVAQTSSTAAGVTPQGNLAAYGVAGGRVGFSKSFVEHGWIMGLVSIRADLTYQQGLDRMWSKRTRFDYYFPQLAHLGEQQISNKEIFCQGASVKDARGRVIDDLPFGYQERWAELRYGISHITGQLRSTYYQSLDVWHLAQEFENLPTLGYQFVQDDPPLSRVLAVQNRPQFVYDSLVKATWVRTLPTYSIPGYADHF